MTKILVSRKTGQHWLVYDGKAYKLEAEGSPAFASESRLEGRQLGNVLNGRHPLMEEFIKACDALNIDKFYSWHGVMNSLGDHASMSPPWNGRELASLNMDAFEQIEV